MWEIKGQTQEYKAKSYLGRVFRGTWLKFSYIKFTSVPSLGVTGGLGAIKAGVGRGRSSWGGHSVPLSLGLPLGPRTEMGGRERRSKKPPQAGS